MAIRLRKSDALIPTRLPAEAFVGDPPVYRETLRFLTERNAFFLVDPKVEHQPWPRGDVPPSKVPAGSALDGLLRQAGQRVLAAGKREAA